MQIYRIFLMRKKLATVTAHRELTVTKMVTASRDWAVTWAVIELWPSRDHTEDAVIELWLRCDLAVSELAVTELWPLLAVTEPWPLLAVTEPWSLGPGAVTTVVTVTSRRADGDHLFSHGLPWKVVILMGECKWDYIQFFTHSGVKCLMH